MTCIVGLIHDGTIYMGGDTLAADVAGTSVVSRVDEKVFTNGEFIMGFCGSFRAGQLLRYAFDPPLPPVPPGREMSYMVVDFVDAWRAVQREKGTLKKEEATLLVGWRGRLFAIEDDFDVGCPADDYYAIGGGSQLALGSLHSTRGFPSTSHGMLVPKPVQRITMALEAATAYNSACRGPYTIVSLPSGAVK